MRLANKVALITGGGSGSVAAIFVCSGRRPGIGISCARRQGAAMATQSVPIHGLSAERRFFLGIAVALAICTFAGFARTYYRDTAQQWRPQTEREQHKRSN